METNKLKFIKSSSSGGSACVGVAFKNDEIYLINTNEKSLKKTMIKYTREEWSAFIEGVKNSEFDI